MERVFFLVRGEDPALTEGCVSFLQTLRLPAGAEGSVITGADDAACDAAPKDSLRIILPSSSRVIRPDAVLRLLQMLDAQPETDAVGVLGKSAAGGQAVTCGIGGCDTGRLIYSDFHSCRELAGNTPRAKEEAAVPVQTLSDALIALRPGLSYNALLRGDCRMAVAAQPDGAWVYHLDTAKAQQHILQGMSEIMTEEYACGLQLFFPPGGDIETGMDFYRTLVTLLLMCAFEEGEDMCGVLADMLSEDAVSDIACAAVLFRHAPAPFALAERIIAYADAHGVPWEKTARLRTRYRDLDAAARELKALVEEGRLHFDLLRRYNYSACANLFFGDRERDPENKGFTRLFDRICACQEAHLKRLEKVNVVFFVISASEWMLEGVYRALEQSARYEPFIVVMPPYRDHGAAQRRIYDKTYDFFVKGGYRTIGSMDTNGRVLGFEGLGIRIDIAFHMTQSYPELPDALQLLRLPLSVLNLYSVYGVQVMGAEKTKQVVYDFYNLHLQARIFADTPVSVKQYLSVGHIPETRIVHSGYAKMDYFYEDHAPEANDIWKKACGFADRVVKVIWSPHHSIAGSTFSTATIQHNLHAMLSLAKKYERETAWIVKPHPALPDRAVSAGLFGSMEEYDAYTKAWDALPNARWEEEISYPAVFASSDGIINDSCSFIAEYMYTGKPMLFLDNGTDPFGELGHIIQEGLYHADGKDVAGIERFLTEVLIGGKDFMQEKRQAIFAQYLDYRAQNGKSAAQIICDTIDSIADPQGSHA